MKSKSSIMWGWEKPEYVRSKQHRAFLIKRYNLNRPAEQHVHNMSELNRALLSNEIKEIKI